MCWNTEILNLKKKKKKEKKKKDLKLSKSKQTLGLWEHRLICTNVDETKPGPLSLSTKAACAGIKPLDKSTWSVKERASAFQLRHLSHVSVCNETITQREGSWTWEQQDLYWLPGTAQLYWNDLKWAHSCLCFLLSCTVAHVLISRGTHGETGAAVSKHSA